MSKNFLKNITLALAIIFISINKSECQCTYENNIDYVGSPQSNDLSSTSATSADDCCNKCTAVVRSSCEAWTYASGICYFKSSVGTKTTASGSNNFIKVVR